MSHAATNSVTDNTKYKSANGTAPESESYSRSLFRRVFAWLVRQTTSPPPETHSQAEYEASESEAEGERGGEDEDDNATGPGAAADDSE